MKNQCVGGGQRNTSISAEADRRGTGCRCGSRTGGDGLPVAAGESG